MGVAQSLKQCMSPIKICPTLPFYSFTFKNCIYIYIGSTWSLSRISYFVWSTSVVQFSSFTNICRIINIYVQYSKMWQYFPCCLAASVGLFNSQGKLVHSVNLTTAKTSTSKFSTPASPVLGSKPEFQSLSLVASFNFSDHILLGLHCTCVNLPKLVWLRNKV